MSFRLIIFLLLSSVALTVCSNAPRLNDSDPNILIIVMDAARADHFTCYGYHRPTTPNIDRFAAEGLRFTQAVSSSSWTFPAHATLFCGLLPYESGAHVQHAWLLDRFPALAELLKKRGYRTAAFSNNPHVDRAQNLDRGFDLFIPVWADTSVVTPAKPFNTEHTNELVKKFLDSCKGDKKPFFIFCNYMDTHNPYEPPPEYLRHFLPPDAEVSARIDSAVHIPELVNTGRLPLTAEEYGIIRHIYDAALKYLDDQTGLLLEHLKNQGLYENTLIFILGDHGEVFGEYGLFTHGILLYRPLVHIPLIVRHPKLTGPPGVREEPVAISDVFYTITELLGIDPPVSTIAPKRNLLAPRIPSRPCYSEVRVGRTVLADVARSHDTRALWDTDGMHYILSEDESYECYDLKTDFDENSNMCPRTVSREQVVARLEGYERELIAFVETAEDLRITSHRRVDLQQERALRALGYVGGRAAGGENEHPHVMEHLTTGIFFYINDSLSIAEKEIRAALAMNPNNISARKFLGGILARTNKPLEAVRILRSVVGKTDTDSQVRNTLGLCLARLGREEEAFKQFRQASEIDPSNPKPALNAAQLLLKRNDPAGAEVYFERVLAFTDDSLAMIPKIVNIHLQHGNWAAAEKLLRRELQLAPGAEVLLMLGRICRLQDKVSEARRYLETALETADNPRLRRDIEKELKAF